VSRLPLPGVIDSHCHLQSLSAEDRGPALERARKRGVAGFLVPATHLEEAEELLALAEAHPDIWCALGVHPHEAGRWGPGDAERLAKLLAHPRAVAVGEVGLDFHYDLAPRQAQERALREQWEVALDVGLPVVVHNRDSDSAMLSMFREPAFQGLAADFHSFSGSLEMARELVARGCWLGVSGMVTFRRAENIREILTILPLERLLLETDAPYLAPVPHRGKPNEPAWVVEVAARVAAERGLSPSDLARQTTVNFFTLFSRAAPPVAPGP
jgi:TatD DNase family protein